MKYICPNLTKTYDVKNEIKGKGFIKENYDFLLNALSEVSKVSVGVSDKPLYRPLEYQVCRDEDGLPIVTKLLGRIKATVIGEYADDIPTIFVNVYIINYVFNGKVTISYKPEKIELNDGSYFDGDLINLLDNNKYVNDTPLSYNMNLKAKLCYNSIEDILNEEGDEEE